jgi:alanyl-tRNA synthetase
VIRRAVQQARAIGLSDLWRITGVVTEQMNQWYPELEEDRAQVEQTVRAEEERFNQTLERGMRLFEEIAARGGDVSGEDAFRLHDTYGFPLELTVELAHERGLGVNAEEFTKLMEEQRTRSRAGAGRADVEAAEFAREAGFETEFVGYEKTDVLTQLGAARLLEDGLFLAKLRESPFYPDGGGQVTDQGYIENEETGARARLHEAHRIGHDQVLVFAGDGFSTGDRVRAVVLWSARFPTMANHTATHLLHAALREVLGDHVRQAGSAVRPDKLRFDFTHERALTDEERARVEEIVNRRIFENLPVHTFETPLEEARKLGAMMLFGEKYGEEVRVVEIPGFSRELCGGTHVRWTAEIGPFVLVSESSVGSGARRIEALTAGEAYTWLRERARELEEVRSELERARKEAKAPKAPAAGPEVAYRDESNGIVTAEVTAVKGAQLRDLSDQIRQQKHAQAVLLGSVDDGRAYLVVNLDRSLVERGLDAVPVAREAGKKIGGGGGGRPNLGEAGGRNPDGLEEAYEVARSQLVSALT